MSRKVHISDPGTIATLNVIARAASDFDGVVKRAERRTRCFDRQAQLSHRSIQRSKLWKADASEVFSTELPRYCMKPIDVQYEPTEVTRNAPPQPQRCKIRKKSIVMEEEELRRKEVYRQIFRNLDLDPHSAYYEDTIRSLFEDVHSTAHPEQQPDVAAESAQEPKAPPSMDPEVTLLFEAISVPRSPL